MNKVISTLSAVLLGATLSGCIDTGDLMKQDPSVDQFYTLDKDRLLLCRGTSNQCQDLTLIASAEELMPQIERIYGGTISGPNYPVSLAKLITEPPQGQYKATPLGESGRYLQLPINRQTDSVWDTLKKARNQVYD
ncbi:hypothetical protein KQ940_12100 [Marinobacterium sp. D7]|uniref:hypothetical protein n=1 Tax=Marinobacterium ramblicola TaxID=2849041 RepID=UPI001C2D1F88|nr:hypothetical protein [Marinobacterium ramblicola]MBV1788798.1 hypothetical protein [Marinobacterium ramblicola]